LLSQRELGQLRLLNAQEHWASDNELSENVVTTALLS
jgi:hypothetical protein